MLAVTTARHAPRRARTEATPTIRRSSLRTIRAAPRCRTARRLLAGDGELVDTTESRTPAPEHRHSSAERVSRRPIPYGERMARLAYLGTPEMAVPPLRALAGAGHDIALCVTRPDRRRGRGSLTTPSPVKEAATELGIPVSHDMDDVAGARVELAVVVAFGRIIPARLLAEVPMVNLHFSLLPRWRGAAPVERAILAGDRETGVCLMKVEEGLDTGPVYATRRVRDRRSHHARRACGWSWSTWPVRSWSTRWPMAWPPFPNPYPKSARSRWPTRSPRRTCTWTGPAPLSSWHGSCGSSGPGPRSGASGSTCSTSR